IIEQVGLRHACRLGDLVDRGTAEAVGGKDLQRRLQYEVALLLLDAGAAARGRRVHGRAHPCAPKASALSGPIIWTSFSAGCGARFASGICARYPLDRQWGGANVCPSGQNFVARKRAGDQALAAAKQDSERKAWS